MNAKGSGFMAAILPSGMRAVSTQISPETGAGGFILRTDRVDVIMTRAAVTIGPAGGSRQQRNNLRNIQVLAIDQNVEEKNGQKVVVGKTATLELSPSQAETLAVSQQNGTLSLALRSIADTSGDDVNHGTIRMRIRSQCRALWREHYDGTTMNDWGDNGDMATRTLTHAASFGH